MSFIKSLITMTLLAAPALSQADVLIVDDFNGNDPGRCTSGFEGYSCYNLSTGDMLGGQRALHRDYGEIGLGDGVLDYDSSRGGGNRGGYYTGGSGQYYVPTSSGFVVGYGQVPSSGMSSLNLDLRAYDAIRVRFSEVKTDLRVRVDLTSLDFLSYADWSSSVLVSASDQPQDVYLPLSGFGSRSPDGVVLDWASVDSLRLSVGSAQQDPSDFWSSPDYHVAVGLDQIAAVPEPETYALFGTGVLMLALARRRKA